MPLAASPPSAAAPRCANCGAAAERAFCPECGQEQHDLHRSLRGVLGELLDAVAGWDGKIPATFRLLLLHPGALTAEFLGGRRTRYLRPLRVFLLASVTLVLALQAPGGDTGLRVHTTSARASTRTGVKDRTDGGRAAAPPRTFGERVERRIDDRLAEFAALPADRATATLKRAFLGRLGTTLFVLVPVFALLVKLLWRRAPYYYAEHAVFALHAHAQGMLAIGVAHLLPFGTGALALAWGPAYLWFALRRVYGVGHESRGRTTLKFVVLATAYGVVLALGLVATFLVALLGGE
ncbi:MAG TPA: DUF3667 domain-containing protein [Gemmatirosa sp.]|nr:DUF3667 domain-containing protein [Gemmatirosa sp.]